MTTGNLILVGNTSGGITGSRSFGPFTISSQTAADQTSVIALTSGANTIVVPAGTTALVIVGPNAAYPAPNPLSAVVLTVKGVAGDTGIAISAKFPFLYVPDPLPASFVINASIAATIEIFWL